MMDPVVDELENILVVLAIQRVTDITDEVLFEHVSDVLVAQWSM